MTDDNLAIPSLSQDDEGNLQIHIPKREFGDFIQGLLAQPRSVKKTEKKFFDIDHAFLKHLNEIVKQRVQSQQLAKLVSFQGSIYFSDGRVQTLTTWDAFDNFVDNSDSIVVTMLDVVWVYLVKFPTKLIPEKQSIGISIDTGIGSPKKGTLEGGGDLIRRFVRTFVLDNDESEISIRVDYTEMTWGVDILRHLDNEVRNKFIIESKLIAVMREFISLLGIFFLPLMFIILLFTYSGMEDATKQLEIERFMQSVSGDKALETGVIPRLDFLIADHRGNPFHETRYWVYMTTAGLIFLSFVLFAVRRPRSYLVLNSATEKYKKDSELKRERLKSSAIVAIVLGVIAEVLGARITELIEELAK